MFCASIIFALYRDGFFFHRYFRFSNVELLYIIHEKGQDSGLPTTNPLKKMIKEQETNKDEQKMFYRKKN